MIRAIFLALIVFASCGCTSEPDKPFIPVQRLTQTVETDDKVEFIGNYELSNGLSTVPVYVYHVTINGKRREVHWTASAHGLGVLSLENE